MRRTYLFSIAVMIIMAVFIVGCVDNNSQFAQKQKAYDAIYAAEQAAKPTPSPAPTPAYQDKELARTIKENGFKYQIASTEIPGVIQKGDLDAADSGINGMILAMSKDERSVKKMLINNTVMSKAWADYLDFNKLYANRMKGAIKNIRKDKTADAKADIITATKYRGEANKYYDIAILHATKELS